MRMLIRHQGAPDPPLPVALRQQHSNIPDAGKLARNRNRRRNRARNTPGCRRRAPAARRRKTEAAYYLQAAQRLHAARQLRTPATVRKAKRFANTPANRAAAFSVGF